MNGETGSNQIVDINYDTNPVSTKRGRSIASLSSNSSHSSVGKKSSKILKPMPNNIENTRKDSINEPIILKRIETNNTMDSNRINTDGSSTGDTENIQTSTAGNTNEPTTTETPDTQEQTENAEILRGALHKTPIDILIKHIRSTPDPDFSEDADITTRLEAYAFNDIIKLPNISAREVSLRLIAESKKEISKTSPIFIVYRGIRTYANKITRARHHHNFLNKCITNEWTPKGLSLQRRINPIGGNAQLEITIREIQFKAEKSILETLLFHYSELSIASIGELEGLEKVLSKNTSQYVINVKCRIILETEELAQSLRKKNIEKAEINRKEYRTEQSRMRRNKTKQKPKQNEPEKQPETTEN